MCGQHCIYTGVYTCEYPRISKRRALPKRDLEHPQSQSASPHVGGGGLHALSPHRACGAGWETGPSDPTCGPGAGSRVSGQVCSMWASDTPRSLKPWSNVQADGWVPYCPLLGRSRRAHVSQGLHSDSSRGQFPFISGRCMAFLLLLFVFSSTAPPQRETHSAYT